MIGNRRHQNLEIFEHLLDDSGMATAKCIPQQLPLRDPWLQHWRGTYRRRWLGPVRRSTSDFYGGFSAQPASFKHWLEVSSQYVYIILHNYANLFPHMIDICSYLTRKGPPMVWGLPFQHLVNSDEPVGLVHHWGQWPLDAIGPVLPAVSHPGRD